MSKIDDLISQYCPDGVEWKKIEEVCKVKTPPAKLKTSDYQGQGLFQIIDQGQQQYAGYTDDEKALVEDGEYILYGDHTCIVKYHKGRFAQGADGLKILTSKANNPKYVYYAFSAFNLASTEYKRHWTQAKEIEIPLPPLPVQEEIVRVLDTFTNLAAELQAELQARQQQYNYYRDTLLSFEGRKDVQWMKLGEVATEWYRGAGIKRDEVSEEGTPCIRYGEIHTTYSIWFDECVSHTDENGQPTKKYADHGDILFAITSEDIPFVGNSVAYLGKERIMVGGDIVVMKHDQDPKYMSYVFSTSDAVKQKGKGKVKSKVVHTSVPSLQEIVVPIPSLDEQRRIAEILDNFHTLTNDLSQGLPAEIEARQQQYEYYRDQLLTFKRM